MSFEPCDHHVQAEKLTRLKQGWDSYKGVPISPKALEAALDALRGEVLVPRSNGGVTLSLRMGLLEFELEFKPDGRYGFGLFEDAPEEQG